MPPLTLPALHASHAGCWLRDGGGVTRTVSKGEAIVAAGDTPLLVLNAPLVATRLGYPDLSGLDLLELFAFVHPARFVVPTPRGLAHALGLEEADGDDAVPELLQCAAEVLLATCAAADWPEREGAWSVLQSLVRLRWPWAALLTPRIARPERAERWLFSRLPEWEEAPERPQPRQIMLGEDAVVARLGALTGSDAEQRAGQRAYAAEAAQLFSPRRRPGEPHLLLAQAGTGIGKTLGYLAPAATWAEEAGGTVWVSTFTKALQRQLRQREPPCLARAPRADGSAAGGGAQGARELLVLAEPGRRTARRLCRPRGNPCAVWSRAGRPIRKTAT